MSRWIGSNTKATKFCNRANGTLVWETQVEITTETPELDISQPTMYTFFANNEAKLSHLFRAISLGRYESTISILDIIGHDAKDKYGHNALHIAASYSQHEMIPFLARLGADVHARTINGATPLTVAAASGSFRSILGLKALGAKLDMDIHGFSPMHYAAWNGHPGCVTTLADLGMSVNVTATRFLVTPLMAAIDYAHTLRTLLRLGADVNAQDSAGHSALHRCASLGKLDSVVVLITEGMADTELGDNEGKTPICYTFDNPSLLITMARLGANVDGTENTFPPILIACTYGQAGVVALAQMGADANARQFPLGDTVLHAVVNGAAPNGIATLVHVGASLESFSAFKTPLAAAAYCGNLDAIAELIAVGADVEGRCPSGMWCNGNAVCFTPLQVAVAALQADAAVELIRCGANINAQFNDEAPIMLSYATMASFNNVDPFKVMELALSLGANVNAKGKDNTTALFHVDSREEVELLIQAGIDVGALDDSGHTPLLSAVYKGRTEVVDALICAGVPVNHKSTNGFSAIFAAALVDQPETFQCLIQHGADVNAQTAIGLTPLCYAAVKCPPAVRLLVQAGADVHLRAKNCQTPLLSKKLHLESAKVLIAAGAQVNVKDDTGNTPLHYSVIAQNVELVRFLLISGANVNIPNAEGKTAYNLASQEIAQLLQDHIALSPMDAGM